MKKTFTEWGWRTININKTLENRTKKNSTERRKYYRRVQYNLFKSSQENILRRGASNMSL